MLEVIFLSAMFADMPKQSPEINTQASLQHVAKEIGGIAADLASFAGDLDLLPVKRFWGGSKSGRELGLRNLRTLCDEVRNCIQEMRHLNSTGELSDLSDMVGDGQMYRYSKARKGTKKKAADKGQRAAKPVKKTR